MISIASDKKKLGVITDYFKNCFQKNLFVNNIKQNKIIIIVIGIVLFLSGPFISIIMQSSSMMNGTVINSAVKKEFAEIMAVIFKCTAILFAIILGIYCMKHNHSRNSAIFYSSIPIKRSTLFTTHFISGIVYYMAVLFPVYIVMMISTFPGATFDIFFVELFKILLVFLLVYSSAVLAANIAASGLNSFFVMCFLIFIVFSYCMSISFFIGSFYIHTSPSNFLSETAFVQSSPLIYYLKELFVKDLLGALDVVLIFVTVIIAFVAGLLLNNINRTESAGKSFFFNLPMAIFKYVLNFLVILLSGIIFYSINGTIVFLILGFIFGGILSYLVLNLIIFKNIREIFKNFKGFIIFAIISSLFITFMTFDVIGIDKYLPGVNNTKSVHLNISYGEFYYHNNATEDKNIITDKETIKKINNVFKSSLKANELFSNFSFLGYNNYIYKDITDAYSYSGYQIINNIFYDVETGFDLEKIIPYIYNFDTQKDSDEFYNNYNELLRDKTFRNYIFYPLFDEKKMNQIYNNEKTVSFILNIRAIGYEILYDENDQVIGDNKTVVLNKDTFRGLIEAYKKDEEIFDFSQSPKISILGLDIEVNNDPEQFYYDRDNFSFSINSDHRNTIDYLINVLGLNIRNIDSIE